jgi:hypothetical protein
MEPHVRAARKFAGVVLTICSQVLCLSAQSQDQGLRVKVNPANGTYTIGAPGLRSAVLRAGVAVELDGHWLQSASYPKHTVTLSDVPDDLGNAKEWTVLCTGLAGEPDLIYRLNTYSDRPFGDIQVVVHNSTGRQIDVESIRPIEAIGSSILNLGAPPSEDRVLSDSFSEGPTIHILDLADADENMHRGVGSQLLYNRQSHMSFFAGALTTNRFLTILRIHIAGDTAQPRIAAYEVDSSGTTEMEKLYSVKDSPSSQQVTLKLAVAPGKDLPAERLLFSVDHDYHGQLETYGAIIRKLHHARVDAPTPMGWWSWTAYYFNLNEGTALANAQWLAQHLKSLGYNFFHIDEGYQYARGEYITPNATLFPHGMASMEYKINGMGLVPGIWTAPFEASEQSWVYEHHPDWLVHDADGKPIQIGTVSDSKDRQYVLDCTNPGAQAYLRKTYATLVKLWGIRYIKLDFMDDAAIEGYYYRPNTTAMEAQRTGLSIIRDSVGNDILLDKDGSTMLNPVGYVDFGRISVDSWHAFESSKNAEPGVAARYYMNRNFYISDPDAFMVSTRDINGKYPLSLDAAKVAIAVSEIAGGMHEIGDDLPLVGSEPERLALIENKDLINMALLGKASTPVDLMSYLPEDEQPSIFLLKENSIQSILTIFNWTDHSRTHTISFDALGLNGKGPYSVYDILDKGQIPVSSSNSIVVDQPPHSVRVLKIIDNAIPERAPTVHAVHPDQAQTGETVDFTAQLTDPNIPAVSYEWNFGDGETQQGTQVNHAYTHAGKYQVTLTTTGVDGLIGKDVFHVSVAGAISPEFHPLLNQRYPAGQWGLTPNEGTWR